jgi:hypothetical protein
MRRRPSRLLVPALVSGLCAGVGLLCDGAAAQEVVEPPVYRSSRPYETEAERAEREKSPFYVTGGADVRDQYFFRGYNRASSGFIFQPYFNLNYTAYEKGDFAVTPHAGAWFSFTEDKGPENPQHWNEFRPDVGVAVDWEGFTFDFQWMMLKSPSEKFQRSEEIGVDVRYDDHHCWPRNGFIAALNPSVSYWSEYYDKNDSESDSFFGLGLEPELHAFDVGPLPVTLSFPLAFGGSWDGYYFTDEGQVTLAGYWTAGIKASFNLPHSHGAGPRFEAEVDYIRLLADSVERANGGDSDDVTLRVGVVFLR